jgi:uncharacterized protein YndB with AHSA1/START domain
MGVTKETMSATLTIEASADTVFGVLTDPATHAAIDGTGWVRESLDGVRLTETGQVFRMAMYHPNHPNGSYEMANMVRVLEPPHAIAWEPGQDGANGNLEFGGWIWRYDLVPVGPSETDVTLTYDWSAVPQEPRKHIQFPPFDMAHLDNSLGHLAELAAHARSH